MPYSSLRPLRANHQDHKFHIVRVAVHDHRPKVSPFLRGHFFSAHVTEGGDVLACFLKVSCNWVSLIPTPDIASVLANACAQGLVCYTNISQTTSTFQQIHDEQGITSDDTA